MWPSQRQNPIFTIFYGVRRGRQVPLRVAETSRILHFGLFSFVACHCLENCSKVLEEPKFDAQRGSFRHRLITSDALVCVFCWDFCILCLFWCILGPLGSLFNPFWCLLWVVLAPFWGFSKGCLSGTYWKCPTLRNAISELSKQPKHKAKALHKERYKKTPLPHHHFFLFH